MTKEDAKSKMEECEGVERCINRFEIIDSIYTDIDCEVNKLLERLDNLKVDYANTYGEKACITKIQSYIKEQFT